MAEDNYWLDMLSSNKKVSDTNNLHYHLDKCKTEEEEDAVLNFWSSRPTQDLDFTHMGRSGRASCDTSSHPIDLSDNSISVASCFAAAAAGGGI